ncbi:MAG: DNA-binding protein [Lachnospiraceae bacterium]|nr:DNA-binding protein [Lachnospiraceae bacterium]
MEFLTVKQVSEKWNISTRRILKLCEDGRIKGASKIAGIWLLPKEIEKPTDARIKSGKYIKIRS